MSKIIYADGKKTIKNNEKDFMCIIDNDEWVEMKTTDKLGNCMYRTAKRLNNYVRKYGVNNFGVFLVVSIEKDNRLIRHTALYNKKQNKIIDVANGRIILMNYEEYIEKTLNSRKTKKNIHLIRYINENPIIVINNDKTKSKLLLNDKTIKKLDDDYLYDLIMDFIKSYWEVMMKEITQN